MKRLLIVLGALVAVVGASCVAEPGDPGSSEVQLLDLGVALEGVVDEDRWRAAPAGCEGRIAHDDMVRRVARAENAPGLAVVVSDSGRALCVDSLESIAVELLKLRGDPSPDPMYPQILH